MPAATRSALEVTPRHLWLALLGGASLARRGLATGLCDARDIARGAWMTLQESLAGAPQARRPRRRGR